MMKLNIFLAFCALAISGLIGYGFYAAGANCMFTTVATLLCAAGLIPALSLALKERPRGTILCKIFSTIFFSIILIINILFALVGVATPLFIIVNGVILILWMLKMYLIVKSGQ